MMVVVRGSRAAGLGFLVEIGSDSGRTIPGYGCVDGRCFFFRPPLSMPIQGLAEGRTRQGRVRTKHRRERE